MLHNSIQFTVAPDLVAKGLKVRFAIFTVSEIPRRRGSALDTHIKESVKKLDITELLISPILAEYRKLQIDAGISAPVAPAEYLLKLIQKSGMLPNINRVVDCYNIVSAQSLLSMGAHDLAKIKGNLQLKSTDGTEHYIPLGRTEHEKVATGEYAAMDEEKIICRLDLKQCDETKCGQDTKDFLVYVQGNSETSEEYVLNGLQKVCRNIQRYCAGEFFLIDKS